MKYRKGWGNLIVSPKWDSRICVLGLFDDLDGAFGAFHLAGSTGDTVLSVYWNRLSVFHFENANRTSVNACFASGAFLSINFDFNHYLINSAF
jgi:hypothetical protein